MRMPLVVSIPCCQDSVIVLSAMLFVLVLFSSCESQTLVQFLDTEVDIDAGKLHSFARSIVAITPECRILLVSLPHLDILSELIDQHDFLDGWTLLIGAKLHAAIFCLSAG